MKNQNSRDYIISIEPRILELLGPSLYTNIYYILAELIANAYDANAKNVYIIQKPDRIIVEDDGTGMSYKEGDIGKYLKVAEETRSTEEESYTKGRVRKKMGRKGIGKIAALSVSEKVLIMTVKDGEKSGFVLARKVKKDGRLEALTDEKIQFERITSNGTSVVMTDPAYKLNKTADSIKSHLIKIFPLVSSDFKIHVITDDIEITIDSFEKEMVGDLSALITLGENYKFLSEHFNSSDIADSVQAKTLLKIEDAKEFVLNLKTKTGVEKAYILKIEGWIGAYRTTRGRKKEANDFPDNFISLLSNGKLGEYNILPNVGKNSLYEVYIVGQLHVDLFEETELPDIALSNRQGYKTDDARYQKVISFVRDELLPQIVEMRLNYGKYLDQTKNKKKQEQQLKDEADLKKKVDDYKIATSSGVLKKLGENVPNNLQEIIEQEMNNFLPIVGLKTKVDSQKKKIMISHAKEDKILADIIYSMLTFNGVNGEEIIYTSSDDAISRIPQGENIFDYLRKFFVDSYSDKKIFVIYVTSATMAAKWFPVTEVGAGWITQSSHQVFTLDDHSPKRPLDTDLQYHRSKKSENGITLDATNFDIFIEKIIYVCNTLGYTPKSKKLNEKELRRYVTFT